MDNIQSFNPLRIILNGLVSSLIYFGPRKLELLSFHPQAPSLCEGDRITLYKIGGDGLCGEVCLDNMIAPFAEKFGGVTRGSCSGLGYTDYAGTMMVDAGPFGKFEAMTFKRPFDPETEKVKSVMPIVRLKLPR